MIFISLGLIAIGLFALRDLRRQTQRTIDLEHEKLANELWNDARKHGYYERR